MFNSALATQGELPRRGKGRPPGGCGSEQMKAEGFRTLRVLLPGGTPQRVSSGQFPGGGTACFLREAKPVKLKKVAFSHFFDTLRALPKERL